MGNLSFQVVPDDRNGAPRAIAQVKAAGAEFRGAIKALIEEAVEEGARVAKSRAPDSGEHHGSKIVDAIHETPVVYHPGGAGGGGYYEASFEVDAEEAPHIKYVFEGTGVWGPRGQRIVMGKGNVMAIQKEGEGVHFRMSSRGQRPNQRWWEEAEAATNQTLAEGFRALDF